MTYIITNNSVNIPKSKDLIIDGTSAGTKRKNPRAESFIIFVFKYVTNLKKISHATIKYTKA